jgi:hypothetical protein
MMPLGSATESSALEDWLISNIYGRRRTGDWDLEIMTREKREKKNGLGWEQDSSFAFDVVQV